MQELANQLDYLFSREGLEKNKFLLKHLDQNLCLPIAILHKEHSVMKHSSEEILQALKLCKNCKFNPNETIVTLLIRPHTNTIIINEIVGSHAEFKTFLLQEFESLANATFHFDGGCVKVQFNDDEQGLKFLEIACNHPTHPLKAYVEPENVYLSLVQDTNLQLSHGYNEQNAYYQQLYYQQYYYQYDNNMFQNLYIRKASDQENPMNISKPFYPPYPFQPARKRSDEARRKTSGDPGPVRKTSNTEEKPDKKKQLQYVEKEQPKKYIEKTPEQKPIEPKYVEKTQDVKKTPEVKYIEKPPEVKYVEKTPEVKYVEKTPEQKYVQKTPEVKVQQSPYVEKKPQSRKVSEQQHQMSPLKKAQTVYKKETLLQIFKTLQNSIKAGQGFEKLNEEERVLLMKQDGVTLEHFNPTQRRKESFASPQQQIKQGPTVIPTRKASEQQYKK